MVRFDTLLKRLRSVGEVKSYERIQTNSGSETMTSTQACRFRELQSTRLARTGSRRKARPYYSLKEAARLLMTEVEDLLASASAGRLQCFVKSEGLRGHWAVSGGMPAEPAARPAYLALTAADCRQIEAYGSVNVYDLEYHARVPEPDSDTVPAPARFVLREPLWVDRARIVLKHPLPK